MFTKDSGLAVPNLDPSPYPELLPFEVTVDEVNTLLGEVDPFKATGPGEFFGQTFDLENFCLH